MRSIISEISAPQKFHSLLESILCNPLQVERIASNSFTHNNGFDKFTLISSLDPEYVLRLHIWWPDQRPVSSEHVHNHSWNFSSAILTGGYNFQLFDFGEEGEEMFHYRCGFPDEGSGYKVQLLGKARIRCNFSCDLYPGCVYCLEYTALHRIINSEKLTSTITLHLNFLRKTSSLLTIQPLAKEGNIIAIPFNSNEFERRVQRYLDYLSDGNK